MSLNPPISVITRAFNRSSSLKNIAVKLSQQTLQDFEWVIIDDCSEEAISEADLDICQPNFGVKVYRNNKNIGLVKSASKGISIARGNFLLLHDDDDYLLPDALKQLSEAIKEGDVGATGGIRREFVSGKTVEVIPTTPPLLSDIGYRNQITTIATLFSKLSYLEVGGIDEKLVVLEDWDLWLKLLLIGDFSVVSDVVAVQRVGAVDQTQHKVHLEQTARMRNKYLRDDILKNSIGLGHITNMPSHVTIERVDFLLQRLADFKGKVFRKK